MPDTAAQPTTHFVSTEEQQRQQRLLESFLPPCDLPAAPSHARPQVGELWALGFRGRSIVLRITEANPDNRYAAGIVQAVRGTSVVPVGALTALGEGLLHMRKICDAGAEPTITPAELYADLAATMSAAILEVGRAIHAVAEVALQKMADMADVIRTTPAELDKLASAIAPGANPACGCSNEIACPAHQNTLRDVTAAAAAAAENYRPGRIPMVQFPPYEPPTLTQVPLRREISLNGRDWLRYELLADPDPFGSYPHWRIMRETGEVEFFRNADRERRPAACAPCATGGKAVEAVHLVSVSRRPMCTACYLGWEDEVARAMYRRHEDDEAARRLQLMDDNAKRARGEAGQLPTPFQRPLAARACSPTLFGGVWNIGR